VNAPLIAAGALALVGAAVHGAGGEILVVRKLSPEALPSSRFGGPRMTKTMIHASWHMTTVGFLTVGCALLLSGSVLDGDAARGISIVAAAAATGFAGSRSAWAAARSRRGPCCATPAPRSSPPPRRWRGGELSRATPSRGAQPQPSGEVHGLAMERAQSLDVADRQPGRDHLHEPGEERLDGEAILLRRSA
jgi:hypothetical protein